ncbi:phage tail protein I [Novosphingobium sp. FSY-8]|uniref:Phage tail protein I n=1 Tax=Novosphingobium ovatum TaxID=1908523 RepID=A0ABW9XAJ0_9SPHN|nr:phage tail protein I [Novosphingobium ovatum]NBC35548.1 phage tail protein I [Novosphingobium ovatum]
MGNNVSLLPPNATALEQALASATATIGEVPTPLPELWNPADCPLSVLPWLAWGLSVDRWRQDWTEAQKRAAVADAIPSARIKGARATVMAVVAEYDPRLTLTEWWQDGGSGTPHTFHVTAPMNDGGAATFTADFARDLHAAVSRVKPARAHFHLRQRVDAATTLPVVCYARAYRYERLFAATAPDNPDADLALQTEYGEPIEGADGLTLEDH